MKGKIVCSKNRTAVRGLCTTVNTCHFAHVLPFRKFDSLSNFIFIMLRRDGQTVSFTENTEAQRGTVTCLGPHGKWQKPRATQQVAKAHEPRLSDPNPVFFPTVL